MVYYSQTAEDDFVKILEGLALWEKHPLGYEHAMLYISDIRKDTDTICTKLYHQNCSYEQHKQYGEKVHIYARSSQTKWYIVYNWNPQKRVAFVNKMLNNYLTIS